MERIVRRPVYPEPFRSAVRSVRLLGLHEHQALRDLTMRCLIRAYCGGWFRATLWVAWSGVTQQLFALRCWIVYQYLRRVLRLSDEEIERRMCG